MFHVVPTLRAAQKAVDAGVDGLVVEGGEGGGFKNPREVSTMVLLPLVREKVDVPIIAAGGICDGNLREPGLMRAPFSDGAVVVYRTLGASSVHATHGSPVTVRVAIDLTALQRRVTGCDRYFLELVHALAALYDESEYVAFLNRGDRARFAPALTARFRMIALPFRSRAARLAFQQAALPLWLRHLDVDVLHSPSFFAPLVTTRARQVLTVHDLTFFTKPEVHNRLRRSRAFRAGLRASMRRADLLLVPSRAVAEQVGRIAPEFDAGAIRVVPHGVAARFAPVPPERVAPVKARLGLARPYLLHVGTLEPRKNLDVLLDAFARIVAAEHRELDLVLVGQVGWGVAGLERRLRSPAFTGRVRYVGYVADDDLPALYAGALLFVFPSAYEGFGLPPLEAMACGTPTVASVAGALAENLAGAAEMVEPSAEAIASAITRLLRDPSALRTLAAAGSERARRFHWEATARATRACYEELARRPARRPARG